MYPVTRGGCGALLHNLAVQLLDAGIRVVVLLDVDSKTFDHFNNDERLKLPNPQQCVAYLVEDVCPSDALSQESFSSWYEWRSYVLCLAAQHVHQIERPGLIEFFDYHGVAFYSLCHKFTLGGFEGSRIAVRYHATIEAMDQIDLTNSLHPDLYVVYSLERASLALAESVLVPSASVARQILEPLYPRVKRRQAVAVPPVRKTLSKNASDKPANKVLFFGRLFSIKGVDSLVDAAISWLWVAVDNRPDIYFVGGDSMQPPDGSGTYADYLIRRIPPDLRSNFHFLGHLSHNEVEALLEETRFAVFPNLAESFCYAAHELYAGGVPLIVSDIAGFEDFFHHEKNCLVFDSTSPDALASAMQRLWSDEALRGRLTFPYRVLDDEVAAIYAAVTQQPGVPSHKIALTALVHAETVEAAAPLCQQLAAVGHEPVLLLTAAPEDADRTSALLFGRNVRCTDSKGVALNLHALRTTNAMVIFHSSDRLEPQYLHAAIKALESHLDVPYVSSWMIRSNSGQETTVDTFALPLVLDIAPMSGRDPYSRAVFRTKAGIRLVDTFDVRLADYAELKHLWNLSKDGTPGLVIPRPLVTVNANRATYPTSKQLSYLVNSDSDPTRARRLAQYFISTWNMGAHPQSAMHEQIAALPQSLVHVLLGMGRLIVAVYRRVGIFRFFVGVAKRLKRAGNAS